MHNVYVKKHTHNFKDTCNQHEDVLALPERILNFQSNIQLNTLCKIDYITGKNRLPGIRVLAHLQWDWLQTRCAQTGQPPGLNQKSLIYLKSPSAGNVTPLLCSNNFLKRIWAQQRIFLPSHEADFEKELLKAMKFLLIPQIFLPFRDKALKCAFKWKHPGPIV